VAVGCASGVDAAVVSAVVAAGAASRLVVFAVSPPGGLPAARVAPLLAAASAGAALRWPAAVVAPAAAALAARSRSVVAAAVAGGPGSGLVAFPGGPCPAVCRPVAGRLSSGRVSGGGSGSWLSVALAVGTGLPVVVFPPAGVAPPAWPGGSWVPAASSGVWAAAVRWSPSAFAGVLPGFGGGAPLPGSGGFPPPDPSR
jgi:hypothetical protein